MTEAAPQEFEHLVEVCSRRLLRTAYLLTGDWGKAEDLLQTALTKTWLRWSRLDDPAAAEGYVRRVMVTTQTKWWRRRWRDEVPTGELPNRTMSDPAYDAIEQRDGLTRALRGLSPRQRAVLVLRYYEDLAEQDVAQLLGCSVGTVKSTASRALERLRHLDLLDHDPVSPPPRALPAWEQQR